MKTFYITTPIYYPTAAPHIGTAYTTIAADIIARWHRLQGEKVLFTTGTDEHGRKIEKAAQESKKTPKDFVDSLVPKFKDAWDKLDISYDHFIRTTDKDHLTAVEAILTKVNSKGDIYKGTYSGLYCVSCEAYYTEKDATDKTCPIHKKPLEKIKEESYFFKLSKYEKKLLDYYESHPDFILPIKRRNEILNRVKEGLEDLSISRSSLKWGIPLPFDKTHTTYVWFDALTNYLTCTSYPEENYKETWPANIHLVGKDILWFHAVIWPAMLLSAGIKLPKHIFGHGWWTINKEKIGKSAGNAVNIDNLISIYGLDTLRYFLIREAAFGEDGEFSEDKIKERHNNELANKLGNLVSRISTLVEKYGLEEVKTKNTLFKKTRSNVEELIEELELDQALHEIFAFIDHINEYIQEKKPWETHDPKVLYEISQSIRDITILLSPFMPSTAEKISQVFNFKISLDELSKPLRISKIKKAEILFKKI